MHKFKVAQIPSSRAVMQIFKHSELNLYTVYGKIMTSLTH